MSRAEKYKIWNGLFSATFTEWNCADFNKEKKSTFAPLRAQNMKMLTKIHSRASDSISLESLVNYGPTAAKLSKRGSIKLEKNGWKQDVRLCYKPI